MHGAPGTPGAGAGGVRIAPIVLKILVTVVVSTGIYTLTELLDLTGDKLWQIAVSVVIGGSVFIVQYMIDFERRLDTVETGHREHSRELGVQFNQLSEAAGLLSDLDEAGMSTSDARRLIKSLSRVGQQGPEIVKAFARSEVESLASVVTDLTGMTAHWPRDNNEWLIRLTEWDDRVAAGGHAFALVDYYKVIILLPWTHPPPSHGSSLNFKLLVHRRPQILSSITFVGRRLNGISSKTWATCSTFPPS